MYRILITAILVLPSIIGIAAAYMLATKDIYGWGWFLVIAFLLGAGALSIRDSNDKTSISEDSSK